MKKKIILWMIVLLIAVNTVMAFGIRPAKKIIDFEPNTKNEYSFRIVNENHEEMEIFVSAEGDLKDYIRLEKTKYNMSEEDNELVINYKLNFPDELSPGENTGKITVVQSIPELIISESSISARLRLSHKITVNAPYPDKYITARIDFKEMEKKINVSTSVNNLGKKEINVLKTQIDVYDNEKRIETLKTPTTSLKTNEEKTLSAIMDITSIKNGSYKAMAKIGYDDQALELSKELLIGRPKITLLNYDKFFRQGIINEFNIELVNEWNTNISNVYAEIFVFKDNKKTDEIKTISFDLLPNTRKKITNYFDAREKEEGKYSVDLVLNYLSYKSKEKFDIELMNEEDYRKKLSGTSAATYWIIGIMAAVILALGYSIIRVFRQKQD